MKLPISICAWLLALVVAALGGVSMEAGAASRLPESELTWKNVTVGGKKTAVFCMYRDSRGIMWMGTNSGLYFYDGVTVHPIEHSKLSGTQIYSIVERDGRLFLGGNNGLLIYNYGDGSVEPYAARLPKEIRCLLSLDNYLWVGSLYGIYRLNFADGDVCDFSADLPHKSVYSILRDSRGIIYVGTYNGLVRWNSATDKFDAVRAGLSNPDQKNLFVNCLLESPERGSIFIGSEGALYEYTPATDTWATIAALDDNII